ncbi:MAG TPA: aminotransferase class I/II-fold pyridoxal phosphate-dependent enzyme [Steroidobacteraceae bacterium]|jgi:cystathionine beta-lyase/cystathionine gamma-synthase|nr:aminotransferase class I/II-fold pyridoxal phosphate-dependent enzyme [Steroidobacteraceae bacterium]
MIPPSDFDHALELSPRRHSTAATSHGALVEEQLEHFGIDPGSNHGRALARLVGALGTANGAAHEVWSLTSRELSKLDRSDRIAWFNAKRFACFQLAKVLDTLQNPLRATYQSLMDDPGTAGVKGPYPLFDNVTALFSATPVITRTATYVYACAEWVEDAFQGKELLHEIYSRLLNPTSICLANHIVDLEAGPEASDYFAWNFNSGMAAIDATLANLTGNEDIVLASRNVYGGTYQLLHDWYGKRSNLNVAVEWFDGEDTASFAARLGEVEQKYRERRAKGRQVFVYLESPCNPHGYVLDVPGICRASHAKGLTVICDATIATPFLQATLRRKDRAERPDFVIHSYTKDLSGSGNTTAGVVIGKAERMFLPKGATVRTAGHDGVTREFRWDETMFWNVYYIKGAFLDSDKAFEVLSGMRTAELRLLAKCINTIVLARCLALNPMINVHCAAVPGDRNFDLTARLMKVGLPAPLFTIDFEGTPSHPLQLPRERLKRLFDSLEPAFGLQVSLGQINTVVLCPALTSHSELGAQALADAGISASTIRISVGDEDPRYLLDHLTRAARLAAADVAPEFVAGFADGDKVGEVYAEVYIEVHRRWAQARRDAWSRGILKT